MSDLYSLQSLDALPVSEGRFNSGRSLGGKEPPSIGLVRQGNVNSRPCDPFNKGHLVLLQM